MKKLIALSAALALLLSGAACSKDNNKTDPTTTTTEANSTVSTVPQKNAPKAIAFSEVEALIESVKAEYNTKDIITLSDGTEISTAIKDPAITAEGVIGGTVTDEQKNAYVKYMGNIRRIVCDRLVSYFPEENKMAVDSESGATGIFMFPDPLSAGFVSAEAAFAKISYSKGVPVEYIMVQGNTAYHGDPKTDAVVLLCPDPTENEILTAIMQSAS